MLISSLSSVLERNVGADSVADFKRTFHGLILGSGEALRCAIPDLSIYQVGALLHFLGLSIAGTWPSANPVPAVAEVLAREEFSSMRVDFEATLCAHARVVLRGLLAEPT